MSPPLSPSSFSALVSVIIPCYNAQAWIGEAINSCLQQTYQNIEIIVVDDGSTDNSLEIIKTFANKIIYQTQPHQGGNVARNRGLELAQGQYIQFLDADDFILPEKIVRQVEYLEQTGADIVYGDWRHQSHYPNGEVVLEPVKFPGHQTDVLESLLGTWWVALAAILYRCSAIAQSPGWDETLKAAQDRDFFLFNVLFGAKVVYQPGCYAIYRRYGNTSVSTVSIPRWVDSHCQVLQKVESYLNAKNALSRNYRQAIASCYFDLARKSLPFDYRQYQKLVAIALDRYPNFPGNSQNPAYQIIRRLIGFSHLEKMIYYFLRLQLFFDRQKINSTTKFLLTSIRLE